MHLAPTQSPTLNQILDFFSRFEQIAIQFLIYLAYIMAAWVVLAVIFRLIIIARHLREPMVFLEVTPPQDTKIATTSTAQLFTLISGLIEQRSWIDRLLLRQVSCSFEIVSSKESGIRYLIRVPGNLLGSIEKSLRAYVPGIQIKETTDFIHSKVDKKTKIINFNFAKHFALPLNDQLDLSKHDPLSYLASNMTRLQKDDLIAIQIILKPMNGFGRIRSEIAHIKSLIRHDRFADWTHNLNSQRALMLASGILETIAHIAITPLLFIADFITGNDSKIVKNIPSVITATPADKELEELVKSKLNQPLFVASVRALLIAEDEQSKTREKGLLSSFVSFRHHTGQSLIVRKNLLAKFYKRINLWQFKERLSGSLILSASEVGALYHFPFTTDVFSEDLIRVRSRELPAPLSLKKDETKFDVEFGVNNYGGEDVPIGLTLEQRQKHVYVIGKTGMGKTTLLTSAIYQDMVNGKGLAVLDPHGDMLQELLGVIPENRRKDVIVFDPSDRKWPLGLNILSPGIKFSDIEDEQEWITGSVLAIFAKITAKEYWGPRMEHILRNTTLTALQTDNPSLYTLQKLLTDKGYQKRIASTLKDPVLRQFWNKEFALLGKMQLSSVTAPLTQRLGNFITTKMSRHILLQEKSTVSISQVMNEGKILLVNLSKGDLGEDMSFFFGTILTSLIWMAAYQRTKIPEKQRRDFFLYVDEFQNFATPRFSEITSEGRKFHVALIASHQNIAQVEDQNILKVVAGNANSIICLKASPDDEKFILPFMEPEVEKGDIVNLAPYHFFMKVSNENSENAFSGITVPLSNRQSDQTKKEVLEYSRKHYATPRSEVEEYLEKLFAGTLPDAPKAPKKAKAKEVTKDDIRTGKKSPNLYQGADTGIDTF